MNPAETGQGRAVRWPAEWETHRASWLAWPYNRDTWPGGLEPARRQFVELVRVIAKFEPVEVLAGDGEVMESARSGLAEIPHVALHPVPTNDAWLRDSGPVFVASATHGMSLVDWEFNTWGGKYPPFDADNAVPAQIARITGQHRFRTGVTLEGGSIDGNGNGIVLTTESCLLNPNRNGGVAHRDMERCLSRWLGTHQTLWLVGQIPGDDTDGHVDQIARFTQISSVVLADSHDGELAEINRAQLKQAERAGVPHLETQVLPMPSPIWRADRRLPASYTNFYIVNGAVIVPVFGDKADGAACATLASCFPNHEIIPLPANDLIVGLGAFHCLTQQEPAGSPNR